MAESSLEIRLKEDLEGKQNFLRKLNHQTGREITLKEMIDYLNQKKNIYKELAEEFAERYNTGSNKQICKNMFYHNVIAYNAYEDILSYLENRQRIALCFGTPDLNQETLAFQIKEFTK